VDLFSNLKIHQRNKKPTTIKPPLTPPRPPLTPPKEGNYSPPAEGSGVVSYKFAKRSSIVRNGIEIENSNVMSVCCV
ncbi:MAG: hypothetical protein LBC74_13715, partial [Planctomycetaceae bacterium]|nr:hypothetical protein [Planctomycetaceae bacterium]